MTKNFQISEFACKGNLKGCECKMTANVKNNILKLAEQLQILRDYLGVPIKINSGFRCADYNDNHVNGAKHSQHKLGKAADIVAESKHPLELYRLIAELIEMKILNFGGVGKYNTFTHVDIRNQKVRFDKTTK